MALNTRNMLRTEEAATYIGLKAPTLHKYRVTGGGPEYMKLGRTVVYDQADLDIWLSGKRRQSTSVANEVRA